MPSKAQIIGADCYLVEKRGIVSAYGQTWRYDATSESSRREARSRALEFGAAHLKQLEKIVGRPLTKTEKISGEPDRDPVLSEPKSARAERASEQLLEDSAKVPTLKTTRNEAMDQRRVEAMQRSKEKLLIKQANAATAAATDSPERKRLATFIDALITKKMASPKTTSSEIIALSDIRRKAKTASVGSCWQELTKATGIERPAVEVGQENPS
jgi:hypothetical protein